MALRQIVLLGAILLVGGCSIAQEDLLPTLTGQTPSGKSGQGSVEEKSPSSATAPSNPGKLQPVEIEPGTSTGTAIGEKIDGLRQDLTQLNATITARSEQVQSLRAETESGVQQYKEFVAPIEAKLRAGTTPDNSALAGQLTKAQNALETVAGNVASLNTLATAASGDLSHAARLLESTHAASSLAGAVDEDRRQLTVLEDEANKTVTAANRQLDELSTYTSRQTLYVARERSNLATYAVAIKNGELYGSRVAGSPSSSAAATAPPATAPPATPGEAAGSDGRRPLVVIRFARPDVEYEQALYLAVSEALARKPDADFDVVAVAPRKVVAKSPLAANESQKNADAVMRALANMGLPAERMTLSATTSDAVDSNEVHLYVR
jgi:hypothetical protein